MSLLHRFGPRTSVAVSDSGESLHVRLFSGRTALTVLLHPSPAADLLKQLQGMGVDEATGREVQRAAGEKLRRSVARIEAGEGTADDADRVRAALESVGWVL